MNEVEEIEVSIEAAKAKISLNDAVTRLFANKDFKAVITDGYFRDYAIQMVAAKSNPGCQTENIQAAIIKSIDGIGSLNQYFSKIKNEADMSRGAIEANEQELETLRSEGSM